MVKNNEENISPETFVKMYMSMTPEQKELFWKLFTEKIKNHENQSNFDNTDP